MKIRTVDASHGWRWIAEGALLFRRNPAQWVLLIAILFIGSRVLLAIPLIGIVAVLVAPNFLAGLAHGAQALERGKPLRLGYLASGFLKNAAPLIAIGGVSLIGQLVMLMVMMRFGGEAFGEISKTMVAGAATAQTMDAMRAAAPRVTMALFVGFGVSLPLIMAVWFAPLLVFFDNAKPLPALMMSLWACLKNVLPMMVYATVVLVPLVVMTPISLGLRQPDLGLWLLAPILIPSLYTSYKDIFDRAATPA